MSVEVKPGDLWRAADGQVYLAQTGMHGILLRRVVLPEQLDDMGAVLISRKDDNAS